MTVPAVTIAIPFHDEERNLAAAIRSVLAQSYADFELLLLDDGSRDRSLEIARSFRDSRIALLSDGERRRLPARLNEVVMRARGAVVARMDADDVSHPERLARQMALLEEDSSCDAVGTWLGLVDDDDAILGVAESALLPASPRVALERGILAHATMVARREWLLRHPYDERITRAEDRDLWCRTVATSRFAVAREPLYVVRVAMRSEDFLGKYVESQRQNRQLFRRFGPSFVGTARTLELRALSHAKSLAIRAAVVAGQTQRIVQRRVRPASAAERAMIEDAVRVGTQRA
jgi:glycosyltransferase involved in cell wall biosynthesis